MLDDERLEKYKKEFTRTLMEVLGKLNALEHEYYEKNEEFDNSYEGNTIPEHLVETHKIIWKEYKLKYRDILREYCTEKVSEDPSSTGSMGKPCKYYFIEKYHELSFIMKTEKKAIIEINYEEWKGSCYGKQFTFHPTESGWKISCVKGRFAKEDSWSRDWM